ncbi:MAG: citramalate synthase [Nitrososphaerota archaeon]
MNGFDYVEILDTTLRDGAQTRGITFTLRDKLNIVNMLDELGIDIIEAGWPGSNPKDEEFFKVVKEISLKNSKIAAFGSTKRKDVRVNEDQSLNAILKSDVEVAVIFGKSWTLHVKEVLKCTPEENIQLITDTMDYLREHGLDVIFDAEHFYDGFKEDKDYAMEVVKAACASKARTVVLCDTNGGSLFSDVKSITAYVKNLISCQLGAHMHNDSGLAVANTLAAVESGVRHVQGTINGLGERCGNADLCQIIPNLKLKMGYDVLKRENGLKMLTKVSRYVYEVTGMPEILGQPYTGRNAFVHKAGVHVDAVLKNPRSYEHVDPTLVGNSRIISVSELSGRSVLANIVKELGLELSKQDTTRCLEEIKRLEAEGYHLELADATVKLLMLKSLGMDPTCFKVIFWWVETFKSEGGLVSRAVVSVDIGGSNAVAMGEGVGPVHALDMALREALSSKFPELKDTRLVNYKVSVVDSEDGTAASVRVFVEFMSKDASWTTTHVSKNILEASLNAIVDGYVYKLGILESRSSKTQR